MSNQTKARALVLFESGMSNVTIAGATVLNMGAEAQG